MPAEGSSANPVDLLGGATADSFAAALPPVLADPAFDAAIVLFVPTVGTNEEEVGAAISRAAATAVDKPVLCTFVSAKGGPASLRRAANVPAFAYPEAAARALGRAAERGEWLRRPAGTPPELECDRDGAQAVLREALATGGGWLDPAQTRRLLGAYGVPLVPERLAAGADAAVEAARELGFPVVLKTATPGAHKTEEGGVILDLGSDEAVRTAAERIGGPLLVQPFVRGGAELLAGAVQDPVFGPLVAFGPGGVLAELIGEAQFRLAPLSGLDAEELVRTGKAGRLVAGFRGTPPADAEALVDLLLRLSLLADDLPEVAELDLNPVLALPDGCFAVDARVRIADRAQAHRTKSW
jgi:acyl-CoA synthetase (NDP forming)